MQTRVAALVVPLAALLLAAAPAKPRKGGHPPVDPAASVGDACESCHAEATPAVVEAWRGGPHGLSLVKCFVCHGSTGSDFAVRPALSRCGGCHPAEALSVEPAKGTGKGAAKGKGAPQAASDCFGCHDPHALGTAPDAKNPHAAR